MAINMNQYVSTTTVADNKVVVNGTIFDNLTDECAHEVMSVIMKHIGNKVNTVSVSSTTQTVSQTTETPKTPYKATKDFVPQFQIKKQTSVDGKELFCICRKNGWTKAEKALMNGAIKKLHGIYEIEVAYEKDGKSRTFKAWGYNTESTAKKHLKELPTVFTVAELNGEV